MRNRRRYGQPQWERQGVSARSHPRALGLKENFNSHNPSNFFSNLDTCSKENTDDFFFSSFSSTIQPWSSNSSASPFALIFLLFGNQFFLPGTNRSDLLIYLPAPEARPSGRDRTYLLPWYLRVCEKNPRPKTKIQLDFSTWVI